MATKSVKAAVAYNTADITGIATFTDSQITSLIIEALPRLSKESTFIIPKQWIHEEKLLRPFNGFDKAKKLLVLEVQNNRVIRVFTMGLGGLRVTFYEIVTPENADTFKVEAYLDPTSKLWRGTMRSDGTIWTGESLPIGTSGNKAFIKRDFAFRFIDRQQVFQPQFTPKGTGAARKWDMMHQTIDGKDYLQLSKSKANFFQSIDTPEWKKEDLSDQVLEDIVRLQTDLPL